MKLHGHNGGLSFYIEYTLTVLLLTTTVAFAKPKETSSMTYKKPAIEELKKKLSPLQCQVTQDGATEKPFHNEFWDHKEPGIYVDIVSGEPLFSSTDKYDSGSGWPSFAKPIAPAHVKERVDLSHGMQRVEIRSQAADSHLGHIFDDGPGPSGKRYCINSASLRFVPVNALEKEGYGQYLSLFPQERSKNQAKFGLSTEIKWPLGDFALKASETKHVATLAAGCFWGVEEIIRSIPGVLETQVGYTGGGTDHPTYKDVSKGNTGHAEAVQILFDPSKLSYEALLSWFFRLHDPTTMNRQGNDRGTQYRSTIFVYNDEQRLTAEAVRSRVDRSGKWKDPVVTEIVAAKGFWTAEEYHQKYLVKNPQGYTCHYLRD